MDYGNLFSSGKGYDALGDIMGLRIGRTTKSKKKFYIVLPCEIKTNNETKFKKANIRFSKAQLRILLDKVFNE